MRRLLIGLVLLGCDDTPVVHDGTVPQDAGQRDGGMLVDALVDGSMPAPLDSSLADADAPIECPSSLEVFFDDAPFCVGELIGQFQAAVVEMDRRQVWVAHVHARCRGADDFDFGASSAILLPLGEVPTVFPAEVTPVQVVVSYVEPMRPTRDGGRGADGRPLEAPLEEAHLRFASPTCVEGVVRSQVLVLDGHAVPERVEIRFSGRFDPP
ncbi:MAG: hypothetical protein KC549_14255 [Myxococcales bacterium]|nr:hypothetical protein [Myxococcales bacterium]MCB9548064.1 hypothetical protein [Myxococcales bacterium]